MYLYIYNGFETGEGRKDRSEALIRRSAEKYAEETGIDDFDLPLEILRTKKGKPYFSEFPAEFSVSHTGLLWVCLMTDKDSPVGVDVQNIREASYDKIAARYFTEKEQQYVKENGQGAFFRIWTCKEAYAKYTGEGLTKELSEIDTMENGKLHFIEIDLNEGVKCSCCVENKGKIWIRKL